MGLFNALNGIQFQTKSDKETIPSILGSRAGESDLRNIVQKVVVEKATDPVRLRDLQRDVNMDASNSNSDDEAPEDQMLSILERFSDKRKK